MRTKTREDEDPKFPAATSKRPHPIPSRTRKLSSSEPMVLHGKPCGRVGRCRDYFPKKPESIDSGFLLLYLRGLCLTSSISSLFRPLVSRHRPLQRRLRGYA